MAIAGIRLEITYDFKDDGKTVIKTNVKKEAISEILENWARCQLRKGADKREANKKDIYQIIIELDLSNDVFYTTSDTGNKNLTAGIILDITGRLDKIEIVNL